MTKVNIGENQAHRMPTSSVVMGAAGTGLVAAGTGAIVYGALAGKTVALLAGTAVALSGWGLLAVGITAVAIGLFLLVKSHRNDQASMQQRHVQNLTKKVPVDEAASQKGRSRANSLETPIGGLPKVPSPIAQALEEGEDVFTTPAGKPQRSRSLSLGDLSKVVVDTFIQGGYVAQADLSKKEDVNNLEDQARSFLRKAESAEELTPAEKTAINEAAKKASENKGRGNFGGMLALHGDDLDSKSRKVLASILAQNKIQASLAQKNQARRGQKGKTVKAKNFQKSTSGETRQPKKTSEKPCRRNRTENKDPLARENFKPVYV